MWPWVGASSRRTMPSRGLTAGGGLKRAGVVPVWSLSCFCVRKGYRKRGVTSALIAAALKAAKRVNAPALEAYPLDADLTPSASGTGYASTFARAGFKTVARRVSPRRIMRHDLKTIRGSRASPPSSHAQEAPTCRRRPLPQPPGKGNPCRASRVARTRRLERAVVLRALVVVEAPAQALLERLGDGVQSCHDVGWQRLRDGAQIGLHLGGRSRTDEAAG
jgi:GNAT superfamily N-acetyltransferase